MKRWTRSQIETYSLIFLQLVLLLLVAWLTFPGIANAHGGDLQLYADASFKLMEGQLPYRDFALEYPPLALLPFTLPRLVTFDLPLTIGRYRWLFLLQSGIFSTLIALTLTQIARYLQPPRVPVRVLLVYAALVTVCAPLLPWRYDIFPALLTVVAFLALLHGQPGFAGIWLGFGIAAKIYPAVLLAVFSVYYLVYRDWRALVRLIAGGIGATTILVLPFVLLAPDRWASFLTYHQQRGLQIESLFGAAIWLASILGLGHAEVVFNYGAFHIASLLADRIARRQTLFLALAVGGVVLISLSRLRREHKTAARIDPPSLAAYSAAALLTFIIANKVFSPQYLVWLLPFIPFLRPLQAVFFGIICIATVYIFPFNYAPVLNGHVMPVLLLNLRNILVAVLIPWLLFDPQTSSWSVRGAQIAEEQHAAPVLGSQQPH